MNVVLKTINAAVQENLETILLMLIVVGSLSTINITLGTIVGSITEKFNFKKFIFGVFKAFIIALCIFALCYTLNLFSLTLELTKDITISTDFISTVEIAVILVVWALDLAKDIVEKIKALRNLKYVTYTDVSAIQQSSIDYPDNYYGDDVA